MMTEALIWPVLAALAIGYLCGSIPFGLLITRVAGAGDLRTIGSGNIGTTNVLRTGRKDLAALTLVCDMLKGTAAVLVGGLLGPVGALAAGFGAVIGHVFPVWLGFRGGKGVATYLGVLLGLSPLAALAFAAVWIAVAVVTRYSSLSALTASVVAPLLLWTLGMPRLALLFAILTVLLYVKHRDNIRRLLAGTESRIGAKTAPPAEGSA